MKKKMLILLSKLFCHYSLSILTYRRKRRLPSSQIPPRLILEFKDSDQVYKGIDVDIINEVAKRAGWDYTMNHPGFDAAVNAVQAGQADAIMAGMTITEARQKVFTFSDPYYDTKIVLYTRLTKGHRL